MKCKYILITGIFFIFLATFFYYRSKPLTPTVTVNGTTFFIELAVTNKEIEKGLSGRSVLPSRHGMLFLRDHKDLYPFWMGGMQFPLDFVWIDGNQIVDIDQNILPMKDNQIPQLQPNVPVDKILEINAGEVEKYGIKIGDTFLFNK